MNQTMSCKNPVKYPSVTIKKLQKAMKSLTVENKKELTKLISNLESKEDYGILDISYNRLPTFIDLSSFSHLSTLIARNCEIKSLEPFYLPPSLLKLDLTGNRLHNLPSLTHCKKLEKLYLGKNEILEITDLPPTLVHINLENNPLTRLKKDCFPNEHVYEKILKSLSQQQIGDLEEPLPEVLRNGFDAVHQYFLEFSIEEDARHIKNLLNESKGKVVVLGESGAGKSSLCQSLLAGCGVLTDEHDRTVVVDVLHWKADDASRFEIFDQGGHKDYQLTNNLLLSSGPCTVIVCHNAVQNDSLSNKKSLKIALDALRKHPDNKIIPVLTHADLVTDCTEICEEFKRKLQLCFKKEQENLEKNLSAADEEETNRLHHIKKQLEKTACNITVFPISSATGSGIDSLKQQIIENHSRKSVKIPPKWVQCYKILSDDSDRLYWSFDDLLVQYKKLYNLQDALIEYGLQESSLKTCLQYLHNVGLIMWFSSNSELEKLVFNNRNYLITMFRALLNHDLEKCFNYADDSQLQTAFKEEEFQNAVYQFRHSGILSETLLFSLWESSGLNKSHFTFFIELLKTTEATFEFETNTEDKQQLEKPQDALEECLSLKTIRAKDKFYYIPWFVSGIEENSLYSSMCAPSVERIAQHLVCNFSGGIPSCLFEIMCVRLQKYAMQSYSPFHRRESTRNSFLVMLDRILVVIARSSDEQEMWLKLSTPVEDLAAMWTIFEGLVRELKMLLLKGFPGCACQMYIKCAHCVFHGDTDPAKLLVPEVFKFKVSRGSEMVACLKDKQTDFPAAIMHPLTSVSGYQKVIIEEVQKYCQKEWSDVPFEKRLSCHQREWMTDMGDLFKSLLHAEDVTNEISAHLTAHQRQHLLQKKSTEQAEYLYQIVDQGSQDMMKCFKQALSDSPCHGNRLLSHYIMTHPSHQPLITEEFSSQLLTKEEKGAILRFKKHFTGNVKMADLMVKLFSQEVIDRQHYNDLKVISNQFTQAQYLVENVLLRGTYQTLQDFKKCLSLCGQNHLADGLPSR